MNASFMTYVSIPKFYLKKSSVVGGVGMCVKPSISPLSLAAFFPFALSVGGVAQAVPRQRHHAHIHAPYRLRVPS